MVIIKWPFSKLMSGLVVLTDYEIAGAAQLLLVRPSLVYRVNNASAFHRFFLFRYKLSNYANFFFAYGVFL